MREDFCLFILSHGRPDRIFTLDALRRAGYTGKWYVVIDDEDATGPEYRKRYGDRVITFSKEEIGKTIDQYDNAPDRRTTLWVRNAFWGIAQQVGCRFFLQLDDDYTAFSYRKAVTLAGDKHPSLSYKTIRSIDKVIEASITFMETTPTASLAWAQGGDFITDLHAACRVKRKAMNSFFCDTEKPFKFRGRFNEDVNTYVGLGKVGRLFFTYPQIQLQHTKTQSNPGGVTELYRENGTYVKSFYTIITSPSSVTIGSMGFKNRRLHHKIKWESTVPAILREHHKKKVLA